MFRSLLFTGLLGLAFYSYANGGYIGAGISVNDNTGEFNEQETGFRVDWGAHVHPNLDLEWSYINFGEGKYEDPTYVAPNLDDDEDNNDTGNFVNVGFGDVNRGQGKYSGLENVDIQGISAGLKWHTDLNSWMRFFAKGSLLAWEATADRFELYGAREGIDNDEDGDFDNLTPCDTLTECRIQNSPKQFSAVNYWVGLGLLFEPVSWLKIRTEYSTTTLKAVGFPKVTYENLSASLELHF